MAKKHKHAEHENHERWLVSYADFITLLFAFFVVMYSVSSVNEGKYRVLSESMVAAFRSSARTLSPIQVGELARSPHTPEHTSMSAPRPMAFNPAIMEGEFYQSNEGEQMCQAENSELRAMKVDEDGWAMDAAAEQIDKLSGEVEGALEKLVNAEMVTVRKSRLSLEIELNSSFLFGSGSAVPSIDAEILLGQLAKVLQAHPNQIHVQGFTDNKPIVSPAFPSNWELSSARAGAVVRIFAQNKVGQDRLASVGYGENKPIATNDTEAGRARNRRVVIVIVANLENQDATADTTSFELLQQQLNMMPGQVN
jgi:chemotaxis protein MotB